jgi:hypothetical protein
VVAPIVEHPTQSTGAGVASYAVDPANAERLWELSEGALS